MAKRNWLISGVSSGFGRIMAEKLLARGDRVAGTVRDERALADLRECYGDRLVLACLDLVEMDAIADIVDQVFWELGSIDVVVSNAGYGLFGAAEEFTDTQVWHQIAVNLLGSIQFVRAALPHLRRQGHGRILQLSSVGGQAAFPGGSLYHASKWGIEGFIDALAQEVAPFGIECTLVEPGGARTDFRFRSARLSTKLEAYDVSPARKVHCLLSDLANLSPGDPAKMVDMMIASVERTPAPKRLVLGSDAYKAMHAQLLGRLAELEAQASSACLTDLAAV